MLIKTEFIGENWGYYVINDETNFYKDVAADEGIEYANIFFKDQTFQSQEDVPPQCYVSSILESIGQSDECPPQLYTNNYSIKTSILSE